MNKNEFIGAIDQGTTSTRFILFNKEGVIVESCQKEHEQIFPKPGWVEHDPEEIWHNTCFVIKETIKKAEITFKNILSIGITNQRETTVVWDKDCGKPLGNAIVWQDTRTSELLKGYSSEEIINLCKEKTGLPPATYFSAPKLLWLKRNNKEFYQKASKGKALFGTIDSWLLWKLTNGKSFFTDVTNASRSMLMNLKSLNWDSDLCKLWEIDESILPQIRPSIPNEPFGYTVQDGPFSGEIPISCILGDQQAALFGQGCYNPGDCKNTYGTGCFLLTNTGEEIISSKSGLLTTVGYQIKNEEPVYALEGSVAVAGALVQWVRDNLGLIKESSQINNLASKVEDSGGVYFVPAFSGLFAPHWRNDARGIIAGLTGYANASHIARAVLEATAFQTKEVVEATENDTGLSIPSLKVDGGMTASNILMQFQSDILDIPIIRPKVVETTALGACYGAGLGVGFWTNKEDLKDHWKKDRDWQPKMAKDERVKIYKNWKKAVSKTLNWF